jgi:predicted nuclease of predicted toxin-antitoxin system
VKVLIDMNLSPAWVPLLRRHGIEAVHWSSIGATDADDDEIMRWARDNEAVVFTHDPDLGIILALTRAGRPSVIQVRTQDVSSNYLGGTVISVLNAHSDALSRGALITVDEARARVRILSIKREEQDEDDQT